MLFSVLFYALVGAFAVQLLYFLFFFLFKFNKKNENNIEELPISVIIHTKNNADLLEQNLPNIINQNYNNFEVVIINDASIDTTSELLENLQKENNRLTIVNVENNEAFWGNKKYALTLGIKAAKNEHLVFTEIYTAPISNNWLKEIASSFNNDTQIVLGYKKLETSKIGLLNMLIRFEYLIKSILNFSLTKTSTPFTAEQTNYAFTKKTFFKVNGYINHMKVYNAQNDLFLKDAATKNNVAICTSTNSFTIDKNKDSFGEWFSKLRESALTKSLYQLKHKLYINTFNFSKFLFYTLAIANLFLNWKFTLPFIIVYYLIFVLVIFKFSKKLNEKYITIFTPLLDICLLCIQIGIFIVNSFSKPPHWK
ncbi:hypothetical protein WH52_00140 [Tenacibaculum holothuriorum]|uniref:Glycosyltransferase 2-like domain-containing protein n=1 Tax=Tenacibaculum holothuriorum TaxID=1635173 RepID=A0A1Y2PH41_9FLAO|nr:glycosyltransferase [Tenacibaculum holothuriorum]OSY89107.1 hypothetical protein WH52_00140 [Tenacibaculum holothuriorum]